MAKAKCLLCGNSFNRDNEEYVEIPFNKSKRYVEKECFDKIMSICNSREEAIEVIKAKAKVNKSNKTKPKKTKDSNTPKDKFFNYIQETYNISVIPKYTFIKLSKINNGEYKGLKEPISYEDLLLMFQKQYNNLNKLYQQNIVKGNTFDDLGRFNYDLAVILSKYDSFKKWKLKQQIHEADINKQKEEENKISVDYTKIPTDIKVQREDEVDISDILDDIF